MPFLWLFLCQEGILWEAQLAQLRGALEQLDWYRGKQILSRLEESQPQRYRQDRLGATRAWIARQEGNLGTALEYLEGSLGETPPPFLLLEAAELYAEQDRWSDAYATLQRMGRPNWTGPWERERADLLCQALWQLGKRKAAFSALEQLLASRLPVEMRQELLLRKARWLLVSERLNEANQVLRELVRRWPASDEALSALELCQNYPTLALQGDEHSFTRAFVFYRNREFDQARALFLAIQARGEGQPEGHPEGQPEGHPDFLRATFFAALCLIKDEKPAAALPELTKALTALRGTDYEADAQFQHMRCLYLLNHHQQVVVLFQAISPESPAFAECSRIYLLSLRASQQRDLFCSFEQQLAGQPSWLTDLFNRHDCAWSLQLGDWPRADRALDRLQATALAYADRLECELMRGLVQFVAGRKEQAGSLWLAMAARDPNHFFSLLAMQIIYSSGLDQQLFAGLELGRTDLAKAQQAFLLNRDPFIHLQLGAYLRTFTPDLRLELGPEDLPPGHPARAWARVGRFDLAAQLLGDLGGQGPSPGLAGLRREEILALRAKWFHAGQLPQLSIHYAETLARRLPRWVPLELYPEPMQTWLFPQGFKTMVQEEAGKRGIDPALILAIIREESRFAPRAKSAASARGLMQFIPATARSYGQKIPSLQPFSAQVLYQPNVSIELGATYVQHLLNRFQGLVLPSIAAYNAGESAASRWQSLGRGSDPLQFIWDISYQETKDYCQKVLRSLYHYRRLRSASQEHNGPTPGALLPPLLRP
jgi:hypothetical protein